MSNEKNIEELSDKKPPSYYYSEIKSMYVKGGGFSGLILFAITMSVIFVTAGIVYVLVSQAAGFFVSVGCGHPPLDLPQDWDEDMKKQISDSKIMDGLCIVDWNRNNIIQVGYPVADDDFLSETYGEGSGGNSKEFLGDYIAESSFNLVQSNKTSNPPDIFDLSFSVTHNDEDFYTGPLQISIVGPNFEIDLTSPEMGGPISGETQTWSQELDLTPYSQFGSPAGNWSLVMSSDGEYIYSYSVTWNAQYLRKEASLGELDSEISQLILPEKDKTEERGWFNLYTAYCEDPEEEALVHNGDLGYYPEGSDIFVNVNEKDCDELSNSYRLSNPNEINPDTGEVKDYRWVTVGSDSSNYQALVICLFSLIFLSLMLAVPFRDSKAYQSLLNPIVKERTEGLIWGFAQIFALISAVEIITDIPMWFAVVTIAFLGYNCFLKVSDSGISKGEIQFLLSLFLVFSLFAIVQNYSKTTGILLLLAGLAISFVTMGHNFINPKEVGVVSATGSHWLASGWVLGSLMMLGVVDSNTQFHYLILATSLGIFSGVLDRSMPWKKGMETSAGSSLFISAKNTRALLIGLFLIISVMIGLILVPHFDGSIGEFVMDTTWKPDAGADENRRGLSTNMEFGVNSLFLATLQVSVGALLIAVPLGLGTAVYLSEYANPRLVAVLKPVLELLAGIPSVVYGLFAIIFISPYVVDFGGWMFENGYIDEEPELFNPLNGAVVVGIMVLPLIASMSEDALHAVPRNLREGSLALGATRIETTFRVTFPAALSGILASIVLAFSRAVGETMAVTLAVGTMAIFSPDNPFISAQTMTAYIAQRISGDLAYGTIQYYTVFAVGIYLFVITLSLNLLGNRILEAYREEY